MFEPWKSRSFTSRTERGCKKIKVHCSTSRELWPSAFSSSITPYEIVETAAPADHAESLRRAGRDGLRPAALGIGRAWRFARRFLYGFDLLALDGEDLRRHC